MTRHLAPAWVTPIRILIVDDHASLAEAMRARLGIEKDLEIAGHVSSADALVADLDRTRPDVVLLDIGMPGRDPLEALAEVVRSKHDVRVIVFTGDVRSDLVGAAAQAGAWGFLGKWNEPGRIVDAIRRVHAGEFVIETPSFPARPGLGTPLTPKGRIG